MFSLLWSEHCAYKHSRKLLRRLPTEGPGGDGAGRERRRGRHRQRLRGRLQGRVAQPPQRRGAVPGGGDRGRRDPARRLRARCPADRDSRLAALRRARLAALALPARRRGARDRPLRQLDRRADGRRRDLLRGPLRAQLPGQRDVRGPGADRGDGPRRRRRRRQPGRADGRLDRARRDRRRLGARLGRAGGGRGEAPQRPDRRPLRGVEAAGVLPGAAWAGAVGVAAGPGRRRAHLLGRRDGLGGRGRDRHRRKPRAIARGRHGALRDHGLRVAGTDAGGGRAGRAWSGCSSSATSGRRERRRSARSPTAAGSACCAARSWSATCPCRRWSTSVRSTTSSRRSPTPGPTATGRRSTSGPTPRRPFSPCWPRPTSRRSAGRSSSTTRSSARARCAGRRPPTRRCC